MPTVAFPPSVGDKDNDGCDTTDMENSTVFTPRPTPRGGKRDAIDLCGCFLQAQDVPYVTIPLSSNYFIRSLNLSGNALHDASAVLIATALSSNGALEELVLSYNAIATEGSLALAACLATNNYLRRLDLSHNHIGGSGLHGWLTLKQNSALEALNLSHNRDISDQGGLDVLRAVAAEPLSLYDQVKLDLLRKNPTHSYTPQLMDAPANATLRSLCLSEVGLSVQSALRLALVLQVNTVLTHLDVSMNGFADDSNVAVAQALAQNRSLTVLNYAANPLSDTAAAIMATSLSGHPALTTVHFSGCFSGPVAGASLASTVISNRTLTSMDLSGGNLEPPGIVALCKAIGGNQTLQRLELTSSGLKSDAVIAVLAQALERNSTLTSLHLGYNKITLRGCKLLKDAIAANKTCKLTDETLLLEGNSGVKSKNGNVVITGGHLVHR